MCVVAPCLSLARACDSPSPAAVAETHDSQSARCPSKTLSHRNLTHFAHSVRLVSRSQHRANGLVCFSLRYSGVTERSTCRTSGARTGMSFKRGFLCVHWNVCHRDSRFHEGQCNTRQGCAIRLFVCGDLFAHNAVAGKVIENRLVFQGGRHVRKGTCGQSS